jgi:hypothetical protein
MIRRARITCGSIIPPKFRIPKRYICMNMTMVPEGTNSKLKMIKRTMYGRCGKELLTAKLILLNG